MKWFSKLFSRQSGDSVAEDVRESRAVSEAEACKNRGNTYWVKGEVDAALACYHEAVKIDPNYAEAFNNLGFAYLQRQDFPNAESYLNQAISLNPALANAHYNKGTLFQQTERYVEALASFQEAISLGPENAGAHYGLGAVLFGMGEDERALASFRRAITLDPDHSLAHHHIGVLLQKRGELDAAHDSLKRAVSLNPTFFVAHYNLGLVSMRLGDSAAAMARFQEAVSLYPDFIDAYYEMGNLLREQGQLEASALYYEKAISLKPDYFPAHNNLGLVLMSQERLDSALASFQEAVRAKPDLVAAHSNIAEAYYRLGRLDESIAWAEKAIALDPEFPAAYLTKGLALRFLDQVVEAEMCFKQAFVLDPEFGSARFNTALALLARGELVEGWKHYRHRFYTDSGTAKRDFPQPEWSGEDLGNKTILVWGDQGVGDEILFASMFPEIVARSRRCIIECAPKLVPLFARSFPDALVVPRTHPPHPATLDNIDVQIAAADLAQWLRPNLESFPGHDGYLMPDPARVAYWRARLAALGPGLTVGFCWRSKVLSNIRRLHYTSLDQWGPIFAVPNVHFVNLQYDNCTAELDDAKQRFGIPLHAFPEVDLFDDLHEAAALTKALDLVISAPTATSGIAAAVGVPTWEIGYGATWVSLGTNRVPWFPSQQMYLRRWDQTWEEPIAAVARDLNDCVTARHFSKDH